MDFGILGPLEVSAGDGPLKLGGRRQRTVLAVLLLNANRTTPIDQVIDLVWGEDPPATARRSTQVYVSRLRQILGSDRIESIDPGYRLKIEEGELDADRFEQAVDAARALEDEDRDAALAAYDEALGMWRGAAFADLADDSNIAARARPLNESRMTVTEERFDVLIAMGRLDESIAGLEAALGEHPYREPLWSRLMLALYRAGRHADALRAFTRARTRLVDDLGIEPSADLRDLEGRILNQDPALAVEASRDRVPVVHGRRNPYKGLSAFGEADARDFFGRERLVETILGRIEDGHRVVAILGASGSGKSSVVSAGVIPALRHGRGGFPVEPVILRIEPGEHPFEALELALATAGGAEDEPILDVLESGPNGILSALSNGAGGPTVLVIDQFEDLFTVADQAVRNRFIEGITHAATSAGGELVLVLAMRADFYDRPLSYPPLADPFVRGMVSVTPLSEDEIREVITAPAAQVGVTVEPELIAHLTEVMRGAPAALPQLQFVLMRLFDSRGDHTMTLEDYELEGGLDGVLARRAEAAYLGLARNERDVARQVFFRLITYGATGSATRRQAPLDEVNALGSEVAAVLDRFSEHRLIGIDRDPVTRSANVALVHEALIRDWGRLQSWIALAQADLQLRESLDFEVRTWVESNRERDYLITGTRLEQYEKWREHSGLVLTENEIEYLDASAARRDVERDAETVRVEQVRALEESVHRRAVALAVVMSIAAIVAAGLAIVAIGQSRSARVNAADAERSAAVAVQERTAAMASEARAVAAALSTASGMNLETNPQRSLLLALHAIGVLEMAGQPIDAQTVESIHLALHANNVRYPADPAPVVLLDGPAGPVGSFDVPLEDLVVLAHENLDRVLTSAECSEFFESGQCPDLPATLSAGAAEARVGRVAADPAQPLAGSTVRVLSPWSGADGSAFADDLARFTRRTGISIDLSSPSLASTRTVGDYDIVGISQPAWVDEVPSRALVAVDTYLDTAELAEQHYSYLLSLMTTGDALRGVPISVSPKSLVWYPVDAFTDAGYSVPGDWDELVALSARMMEEGRTPWCLAEAAATGDGWPATDFVEDLVLQGGGLDVYDRWVTGEIPFESDEIRLAFSRFGDVAFPEGSVYGGLAHALVTHYSDGIEPMKSDPPRCWLYHQGATTLAALSDQTQAFGNIGFFPTPPVDRERGSAMLGTAVFASAVTDRPEVRELMRFLASDEFGLAFAQSDDASFIAANKGFDRTFYGSGAKPDLAEVVHRSLEDGRFRFDASIMMGIESEFRAAMISYLLQYPRRTVDDPADLDPILRRLDGTEIDPPVD